MEESVVRGVSAYYRRRVWWVEREDIEQEARLAVLAAAPYFDQRVGVPRSAYLRTAARRAVGRSVWAMSSPVKAAYGKARGLHRAPLNDNIKDERSAPDEAVDREMWRARVLARLHEIASADPVVAIGLEVLMLEVAPREYAARSGLSRAEVYACTVEARHTAGNDPELFALWAARP